MADIIDPSSDSRLIPAMRFQITLDSNTSTFIPGRTGANYILKNGDTITLYGLAAIYFRDVYVDLLGLAEEIELSSSSSSSSSTSMPFAFSGGFGDWWEQYGLLFSKPDGNVTHMIKHKDKIFASGFCSDNNFYNGFVAALDTNGKLDETFGINGLASINAGTSNCLFNDICIDEGKINVVGYIEDSGKVKVAHCCFNEDGSLESKIIFDDEEQIVVGRAMAMKNGSLAILCQSLVDGQENYKVILKNGDEQKVVNLPDMVVFDLAMDSKGNVILVGSKDSKAMVCRLVNGALDEGFGLADSDEATSMNISVDINANDEVVAGGCIMINDKEFLVMKLTSDGKLDNSFGEDGRVVTAVEDESICNVVRWMPDGKVLAGGSCNAWGTKNFAVVNYMKDGTLNETFGNNGAIIKNIVGEDTLNDLILDNNMLYMAGSAGHWGVLFQQEV